MKRPADTPGDGDRRAGQQESHTLAPPENRSPPTATAQASGSPTSTSGSRRPIALIVTAAAVVAGIVAVAAVNLLADAQRTDQRRTGIIRHARRASHVHQDA